MAAAPSPRLRVALVGAALLLGWALTAVHVAFEHHGHAGHEPDGASPLFHEPPDHDHHDHEVGDQSAPAVRVDAAKRLTFDLAAAGAVLALPPAAPAAIEAPPVTARAPPPADPPRLRGPRSPPCS